MVWFLSKGVFSNAVLLSSIPNAVALSLPSPLTFVYLLLLLAVLFTLVMAWLLHQKSETAQALLVQKGLVEEMNKEIADRNTALRHSKNEIEKLLRIKTNFIAQMSHEIRTPLNAILGLSELLLKEAKGSEVQDKLQSIRYAGDILLVIINDILDLASLEEGAVSFDEVPIRLHKLAQEIHHNLSPKALQKDVGFEVIIAPAVPHYVLADRTRLYQVLINLSNNALKFTNSGKVTLEIQSLFNDKETCRLRFVVADTGIGIKEEMLPHIFKSFEQGGSDIQKKYGGTGLGLTITQRLVGLMGGEVTVSSTKGLGSVFSFELTFKLASKDALEMEAHDESESRLDFSNVKLLYVEDNLMNQKVMSLILKTYGIQPILANNGLEALDLLEKHPFDLVFMDFRMPEMDGFTATRNIRAYPTHHFNYGIPVIGVTADVFDESAVKGLSVGMNDTLTKPIETEKLAQVLVKYLKKQKQHALPIPIASPAVH